MQGKEMSEQASDTPVYLGIDISKDWLDVHIHPHGDTLRLANTKAGHKELLRRLRGHKVALIALEATGKWHRKLQRALHGAGHPVAVLNPYRVRKLADALGLLAKTDAIDARVLALFAQRIGPPARPPCSRAIAELKELVVARRQTKADLIALRNRLDTVESALVARQLRQRIATIQGHIAALERQIDTLRRHDPQLAGLFRILVSIPGIGPVAATTLIAEMSELGHCSRTQIAALAGVAPMNWDSGKLRGQRRIKGGRAPLRAVLYMAAVAASRHNHDLRAFYQRLLQNGKRPKQALTAVMRKLIVLANTLVAENRTWSPQRP